MDGWTEWDILSSLGILYGLNGMAAASIASFATSPTRQKTRSKNAFGGPLLTHLLPGFISSQAS
jgi:hypothetical protein